MELAVGASEATLKSLLSKLGGLLAEQYALVRGVRGDIQFITDELASMQAFLSNLGKCGDEGGHDDQTEDWMKQIRDVAYDIEDCVDDFAHSLRPDPRGTGWLVALRKILDEIRTSCSRREIAAQIIELKNRAQQIGERRSRYGVRDPEPGRKKGGLGGATGYLAAENQEITRQLVRVQKPLGVKSMPDLERWIGEDDKRKGTGVLTIVGFGGVGKTTVAMELYRKFGPAFQCRAMVTVSQNSDPEAVLRSILNQVRLLANNRGQRGQGSTGAISEKNPAIGTMLSRIRKLYPKQKQDSGGWCDKHEQITKELENHLEKTRRRAAKVKF